MKRALWLSLATCTWVACGLMHGGSTDEAPRTQPAADMHLHGELAGHAAPARLAATGGKTPELPSEASYEQLWIGEVWSISSAIFCDPEHPWSAEDPWVSDPMGFKWRTELKLDVRDPAALSGSVQFGENAVLPARPDNDPITSQSESGSFWGCSVSEPAAGFRYRIVAGRLTDAEVELEIAPNQIWDRWCGSEKPVCPSDAGPLCAYYPTCVCEAGSCRADLRAHYVVSLSHSGDSIEGHLGLSSRWGTKPDVRLRRLR